MFFPCELLTATTLFPSTGCCGRKCGCRATKPYTVSTDDPPRGCDKVLTHSNFVCRSYADFCAAQGSKEVPLFGRAQNAGLLENYTLNLFQIFCRAAWRCAGLVFKLLSTLQTEGVAKIWRFIARFVLGCLKSERLVRRFRGLGKSSLIRWSS